MKRLYILLPFVQFVIIACSQPPDGKINLNQVGFYPNAAKFAVAGTAEPTEFFVVESTTGKKVFTGKLQEPRQSDFSGRKTCIADFTPLTKEGSYRIEVPVLG